MKHKLSHVVRIPDTHAYCDSHTHHPVTWCDTHVPKEAWKFTLEVDQETWAETYVFMFLDQNIATQFALLYG